MKTSTFNPFVTLNQRPGDDVIFFFCDCFRCSQKGATRKWFSFFKNFLFLLPWFVLFCKRGREQLKGRLKKQNNMPKGVGFTISPGENQGTLAQ